MKTAPTFYTNMEALGKMLSEDPETKDRYANARHGGKEWFCLSKWIAEDRSRWDDKKTIEYRDSLVAWLGSIDIVYVLQFETDIDVVAYLKSRLAAALDRETSKERLCLKANLLGLGLECLIRKVSYYAGHCGGRLSSVYRARADYLRGQSPGAPHWTHPDSHLYLDWFNKYKAPAIGLYRVQ